MCSCLQRKVLILEFLSKVLLNMSMLICGASSALNGSMTTMSINPSLIDACGAMYALLPYCEAFAHEMRNALSLVVPCSSRIS